MSGKEETIDQNKLPAPIAEQETKNSGWLAHINPQNAGRVVKGIGRLAGVAGKVHDGLASKVRDNKSRDIIAAATASRIAEGIASEDPRMERTFQREAARLLDEQTNLDDIAEIATEALGDKGPEAFAAGELEDDWLYQFEHAAKGFSSERMKHTFGRVLAGEILRPGSFSPATLRAITTLSSNDALLIRTFVSLCYFTSLKLEPMLLTTENSPGNNGLAKFGLSFTNLSYLQQCGFLSSELDTRRQIKEVAVCFVPSRLGKAFLAIQPTGESDPHRQLNLHGLFLTKVGQELATVVDAEAPHPEYVTELKAQFENSYQLTFTLAK